MEDKDNEFNDDLAELSDLRFFLPAISITNSILDLNKKLNDAYIERQYREVFSKGELRTGEDTKFGVRDDDHMRDSSWRRQILAGLSGPLFQSDEINRVSDKEFSEFFQKDVAERIYDHLAMLSRVEQEDLNGAFSIRNEIVKRMAGSFGLDLMTHEKTPEPLKKKAESTLHNLGWAFQQWFMVDKKGHFSAIFGEVYAKPPAKLPNAVVLLLDPDVEEPVKKIRLARRKRPSPVKESGIKIRYYGHRSPGGDKRRKRYGRFAPGRSRSWGSRVPEGGRGSLMDAGSKYGRRASGPETGRGSREEVRRDRGGYLFDAEMRVMGREGDKVILKTRDGVKKFTVLESGLQTKISVGDDNRRNRTDKAAGKKELKRD